MYKDSQYGKTILRVGQIKELNTADKIKHYMTYLKDNYSTFSFFTQKKRALSLPQPIRVRLTGKSNEDGELMYSLISPNSSLTSIISILTVDDKMTVYWRHTTLEEEQTNDKVKHHFKQITKHYNQIYKLKQSTRPHQIFKNYGQN